MVTFNQRMDRASVEAGLVLREDGGPDVAASFAWSEGDTVVTLTPAEPLALGTVHSLVAPAGLRGASAGAMPSNRSSRFTVVEQPKLVSTDPPGGATDAWPYNITLYYNNPMDIESFEDRITVSGIDPDDITLRWYDWSPEAVRIGVGLEYSTEYSVSVAEGARDRGGRTLPAHEFSFTTREAEPPRPWVALAAPASFVTFAAADPQVLYYHALAVEEAHFRLYRLSDSEAEDLLRRGFIDGWRESEGSITFWPDSEPVRSWTEPIGAELRDTSRLYSTALSVGEPLPKGHYFLAADDGDDEFWRKLVLSVVDTAVVTKLAFDELLVWALDYETGRPLSGVPVNTAPLEDPPSSPYQTGSTDSDGLARFAVSSGRGYRWDSYGQHLVRIEEDGRSGVASTWWDVGASPWQLGASSYVPGRVGHVYTDRPIYRPGETVYYKAVVRDDDDASYSVPGPGTEVSVTIRDPRRAYVLNTTAESTSSEPSRASSCSPAMPPRVRTR